MQFRSAYIHLAKASLWDVDYLQYSNHKEGMQAMRSLIIDHAITKRDEHSLNRYLGEISKMEMVSPEEEVNLARKIRSGDNAALNRLVKANLRFVVSCAKKYQHLGLPLADLINEGNIGLIKAARLFDETKGFKFISYAVWWIRQSIMVAISNDVRAIRLPMSMVKLTTEIRKVSEWLEQNLERIPSREEILEHLYVPNESKAMDYAFGSTMVSLDEQLKEDSNTEMWATLEDRTCKPTDQLLMDESFQSETRQLLQILSDREQRILLDYFGFDCIVPKSLEDIGAGLNLHHERIRQLRDGALEKIRKEVKERKFAYV